MHNPKTINPIPPLKFIKDWEKDYKTMQEQMIYGESPSFFNEMLKKNKGIHTKVESNGLEV